MLVNAYAKSSPVSRLAVLLFAAVFAGINSWDWLVNPHVLSLKAAQTYAAQTDSFCKKGRIMHAAAQLQKMEAQKLSVEVKALEKRFFSLETAQIFFTELESIANQNGVTITSLKLIENAQDPKQLTGNGVSCHQASLSVIGKFVPITNLLKQLSDYEQKLDISAVSLITKNDRIECSMILSIYVLEQGGKK